MGIGPFQHGTAYMSVAPIDGGTSQDVPLQYTSKTDVILIPSQPDKQIFSLNDDEEKKRSPSN